MSDVLGGEGEAPPPRPSKPHPGSYTETKLQHASPQHLHVTSRRCFIGPIPEAWLSRHRKSWYRYRPHLSTYSSKTATFDASANVTFTRQLSGLESSSPPSAIYAGPSFPQPDDLTDDAPISLVEPHSPDLDRTQAPEVPSAISKSVPAKQISFSAVPVRNPNEEPASHAPKRPGMPPRDTSQHHKSYVTAKESLEREADLVDSELASPICAESSGSAAMHQEPVRPQHSNGTSTEATVSGKTAGTANSVSSLLRYEGLARTSSKLSAPNYLRRSSEDRMRTLDPVATGFVHFQESTRPDEDNSRFATLSKRPALTSLFKSHTQPGELIKAERMLVRVDWTKSEVPSAFNEKEAQRIETTEIEKWREFMVICRRNGTELADSQNETDPDNMDDCFLLQMSKSRVLPLIDQRQTSSRCAHEIVLRRQHTRINIFSALDKTIVLWKKSSTGSNIFLFRTRSAASAIEWYTFLNSLLGWKRPATIPIHVPDLNVTLNIDKPFRMIQALQDKVEEQGSLADLAALQDAAKGSVAYDLIDRSLHLLKDSPVSDGMTTWVRGGGDRIGLAWKRYDRLEWVHGINEEKMYGSMAMQESHELELRIKAHYPTKVCPKPRKHASMEEPAAVEGFLVRLTSQKGRHKRFGKGFFKRLYFYTHDQYLCFCQPANALPPKPSKLTSDASPKQTPKASDIAQQIPLIYAVNPYPLENEQIPWMKNRSSPLARKMDQLAIFEARRRTQTMLATQGFINLCHIERIRKISQTVVEAQPPPTDDDSGSGWSSDNGEDTEDPEATRSAHAHHAFELVLRNGLTVRLQAYDSLACQEWIRRLRRLSTYWKHRVAADTELYKDVRNQNLKALNINEEIESMVGQFAQKWEVTRAIASAELFNMCPIARCRTITMSGQVYYKPRLRAKFSRCTAILCDGKLIIFEGTLRETSGREIRHIHNERRQVLDLEDTYVYSGLVTENDLLYRNQTFDSNHPGHHPLPRIYRDDQWTTSDEDSMTCFAIWHRTSRTLFRAQAEEEDGKTKARLRYVSSLGRPGRSMVFKTRSRAERDHWVMNIHLETDRVRQREDLRLT